MKFKEITKLSKKIFFGFFVFVNCVNCLNCVLYSLLYCDDNSASLLLHVENLYLFVNCFGFNCMLLRTLKIFDEYFLS